MSKIKGPKTRFYRKNGLTTKVEFVKTSDKILFIDPKRPEIGYKSGWFVTVYHVIKGKTDKHNLLAAGGFDEKPTKQQLRELQVSAESRLLVQYSGELVADSLDDIQKAKEQI